MEKCTRLRTSAKKGNKKPNLTKIHRLPMMIVKLQTVHEQYAQSEFPNTISCY